MQFSYRLKGPIGPPYTSSRHKRNHHDHHHHRQQQLQHNTAISFRSGADADIAMWRQEGRALVLRHRRSVNKNEAVTETGIQTEVRDNLRFKRQNQECNVDYHGYRRLRIGCTRPEVIDVIPSCPEDGEEGKHISFFYMQTVYYIFKPIFFFSFSEYICHGQWQENTTTYIVAKHSGSSHGVCITFKQNVDGTAGQLTVGDSCHRGILYSPPPTEKHLVANLTQFGKLTGC
jgi:hypothetical protein